MLNKAFHLIEPRIGWDEVKMHVFVAFQPAVVLGFVGIQIVQDDMDFAVGKISLRFPPDAVPIVSRASGGAKKPGAPYPGRGRSRES